jgi:hypothetical protein
MGKHFLLKWFAPISVIIIIDIIQFLQWKELEVVHRFVIVGREVQISIANVTFTVAADKMLGWDVVISSKFCPLLHQEQVVINKIILPVSACLLYAAGHSYKPTWHGMFSAVYDKTWDPYQM